MQDAANNSHVILVAFHLDGSVSNTALSNQAAQEAIIGALNSARVTAQVSQPLGWETSWWIAEDERFDGSDCDSAVFVPGVAGYGEDAAISQADATILLSMASKVGVDNAISALDAWIEHNYPDFPEGVE